MSSRRDPLRPADAAGAFLRNLRQEMRTRRLNDTVADDWAEEFLGELSHALLMLDQGLQAEETDFTQATRKADHIEDFRRILRRLHLVLADWEESA